MVLETISLSSKLQPGGVLGEGPLCNFVLTWPFFGMCMSRKRETGSDGFQSPVPLFINEPWEFTLMTYFKPKYLSKASHWDLERQHMNLVCNRDCSQQL